MNQQKNKKKKKRKNNSVMQTELFNIVQKSLKTVIDQALDDILGQFK